MKALLLLPCQERAISKRKRKRQAANDDACPPSPAAVPPTHPPSRALPSCRLLPPPLAKTVRPIPLHARATHPQ